MNEISTIEFVCAESPVWSAEQGMVYWVDNVDGGLYRYDLEMKSVDVVDRNLNISAFAFNADGGLICGGSNGIFLYKDGKKRIVAKEHEDVALSCNDGVADAQGRFVFGTSYFDDKREYRLGGIYLVDNNGSVKMIDEGLKLANGIDFSPDNKYIYYADSIERCIYRAKYSLEKGAISDKQVFIRLSMLDGIPDGLAVDSNGDIWVAEWFGGCVSHYDNQANLIEKIYVPAKQVASLAFVGDKCDKLFITTASYYEELSAAPIGYSFKNGYNGGRIYLIKTDNCGRRPNLANIRLS